MDSKKALNKCMHLCSQREYCVNDIIKKLIKWEINQKEQQEIINLLTAQKYIDHNRYASAFIKDKFNYNHWGKIKIKYHLQQKKIENATINKFINTINDLEYDKVIRDEFNKKWRTVKGKNHFDKTQKTARYLISKGFETNKVFELLKMN